MITDGRQTTTGQYTKLSVASQGIKNKGVAVYAVGVGTGTERAELEEIASRPEYVFTASSFEELMSISSGLTRRLCEGNEWQLKHCSVDSSRNVSLNSSFLTAFTWRNERLSKVPLDLLFWFSNNSCSLNFNRTLTWRWALSMRSWTGSRTSGSNLCRAAHFLTAGQG